MAAWIRDLWRKWTTSTELAVTRAENRRLRETNLALEAELEQARKELRAAVNNLLSHAGAAPLPGAEEVKAPTGRIRHLSWQQRQRLHAVDTRPSVPLERKPGDVNLVCGYCQGAHDEKDCLLRRKEG